MQRPGGQGTAFSIDSLIGTPPPRSGHLLYTGYPMFMPYRPLVLPQALSHAPLQSGLPPLAPLASFAGRLTNTFCASLGQAVPSMVALTTALPSFSEPPDGFYPPQELPPPRATPDAGCRRGADGLEAEELPPGRDKGPAEPPLHFPDPFPGLAGKSGAGPSCPAESSSPASPGPAQPRGDLPGSCPPSQRHLAVLWAGARQEGSRGAEVPVAGDGGAATGGGGGTCPRLRSRPGPQLSGRAGRTEPIPLRPRPGPHVSQMGVKLRWPRSGRGAGGTGERPVMGDATAGLELSEVLALGPGRVRRKVAGRPTARSAALSARTDLGPGARTGPIWCGAGCALSPAWCRGPGAASRRRRAATTGFLKFPPSPLRRADGGAGPAPRRPPAAPLCSVLAVAPAASAPARPDGAGRRQRPSRDPRCGRERLSSGSSPLCAAIAPRESQHQPQRLVAPYFSARSSTHLFSLGSAAQGVKGPCGKTQASQLQLLWRGLS